MGFNSGFKGLKNNSMEGGLIINEKKTKYLKRTKKTRNESLNINNLQIEQVQKYKHLESIVNVSNSVEEEIKERIVPGTKAYYADLKFFKSRLVTKQSKLKLYRTVIRPVVTCLRNMGIERTHNSETISS